MLAQAARVSADAVKAAVTLTNDCIKDGNAVEATSKAAASAWRSSQVSSQCPSQIYKCQGAVSLLTADMAQSRKNTPPLN